MAFELYNMADNTTGEIVQQIGADVVLDPGAVTSNTPAGTTAYLGATTDLASEWYYVGTVKTSRPLFSAVGSWNVVAITADGVDDATFGTSLPNPTLITVNVPLNSGIGTPAPFNETSGSFSLTTTVPGVYQVTFSAFPYRPLTTEITAS